MILLLPLAFLVGALASMIGIGGGVFIVPTLTLLFNFNAHQAVGTTLTMIIFMSLASTLAYSKQRRIDYKMGLTLAAITIPGAVLGAYLASLFTSRLLGLTFAFFLIFIAANMTFNLDVPRRRPPSKTQKNWQRKIIDAERVTFKYNVHKAATLTFSFFAGLSSGLLGIGGGALMVPILLYAGNMPIHVAVATSLFIMVFTSTSGAATHISLGNVSFEPALYLIIGAVLGAQVGARFAKKTSGKNLKRVFGIILFLISISMILKYA